MSEYISETSAAIKSESTNCIDGDLTFQEPPKEKIKKESDDDTQYDSACKTSNNGNHMSILVRDTEPANNMSYLRSLLQKPPNPIQKGLLEQSTKLTENIKFEYFSTDSEDSTEIAPTKRLEAVEKIPTSNILEIEIAPTKHLEAVEKTRASNTLEIEIAPAKHLETVEKTQASNTIEINIDEKICVLDLQKAQDMLAVLHEMYPDEKEAVIYARNEWGALGLGRCRKSMSRHELQLQNSLRNWHILWLHWHNGQSYDQAPFSYKCYICNEAWWTLQEFRNHIVFHPNSYVHYEIVLYDCNIVAYEDVQPKPKKIRIYSNCFKCGRDYDYHNYHTKCNSRIYRCDYCDSGHINCRAATYHMSRCPNNPIVSNNLPKTECQICQAPFYTEEQLSKHLSMFYRVRSDEPVVNMPLYCAVCDQIYALKNYHICRKTQFNLICHYCHRTIQSECDRRLHTHMLLSQEPVHCPNCDIKLPRKCLLREHYVRFHCGNFLFVYVCPLCVKLSIFLSFETAKRHMVVEHSGERHSTIVMPKALLQACLQSEYDVQLSVKIDEVKSLSAPTESSKRTQYRFRGQPMEQVKVYAPTRPLDKVTPVKGVASRKTIIVQLEKVRNKEIDRSKLADQLNEQIDLTPDVIGIKGELMSETNDSEFDNDAEVISDDDDTSGTVTNTECDIFNVQQERTTAKVTEDSELENIDADIVTKGTTERISTDPELDNDDTEIISDSQSDDDDTGIVRNPESVMSRFLQERITDKLTKDSKLDVDTVGNSESVTTKFFHRRVSEGVTRCSEDNDVEIISDSKSDDDHTGTDGNCESVMSKVHQEPTTEKATRVLESHSDAVTIIISKSHDLTDTTRNSGTYKVLQETATEKYTNGHNSDDDVKTISDSESVDTDIEIVSDSDTDTSDALQEATTEKVTDDFDSVEYIIEALESESELLEDAAALDKGEDFSIVLDSTDSDEDSDQQTINLNLCKPTVDVKKKKSLNTGHEERKIYYCKCGFRAYHTAYREHMESGCKKSKPSENNVETIYRCTRCYKGFTNMRLYVIHLRIHGYGTVCPQCEVAWESNFDLWRHIMEHVRSQFILTRVLVDEEFYKKQYHCITCDAVSDNIHDSFVHWERHLQFKDGPSCSLVPFRAGVTQKQVTVLQCKSSKNHCAFSNEPISSGSLAMPGPSAQRLKRRTDEVHLEPTAKRPNLGNSAANRSLAVVLCREDGVLVDEALAKLIRRKLTQLIELVVVQVLRREPGVVAPRFATSGLIPQGYFLVIPESTEARKWLLSQDFGELDGHRIIARRLERTRVQVWIPGASDTEHIKQFLYAQNPDFQELRIMEWEAVKRETRERGTLLTFEVPDGVEECWGEEIKVLNFSATKVRLRILRDLRQGNCTDLMQPTACPQCGKVFDNKSLLRQHVRTAHVARCLIYSKTFNTRKEKNDHLFDEHKHCNSYAKCPLCDQTFRTIMNEQKHVNNQHGRNMSLGRLRFQMLCELRDGAQRDTEKKGDDNISKGETRGVVESRGETRGGGDRSDVLELESSEEEGIMLNDADLLMLS